MIPINISVNPGVVEHVHIGKNHSAMEIEEYQDIFKEICDVFSCSYEEIIGIDPYIVVHEIKT